MKPQDLRQERRGAELLSIPADLDRLLKIMARWWDGWSGARIAREYGVSRQRVGRLLARVGCTRRMWRMADRDRPDSRHRALPGQIAAARAALLHPLAGRLTVRQRAALAWQAQGLCQANIARRMVTTPQGVRNFIVAAYARLERLSRPRRQRRRKPERIPRGVVGEAPPVAAESIDVDWQRLFEGWHAAAPGGATLAQNAFRRDLGRSLGQDVPRVRGAVTTRTGQPWPRDAAAQREESDARKAAMTRRSEDASRTTAVGRHQAVRTQPTDQRRSRRRRCRVDQAVRLPPADRHR